jgi:hypothetical protein
MGGLRPTERSGHVLPQRGDFTRGLDWLSGWAHGDLGSLLIGVAPVIALG